MWNSSAAIVCFFLGVTALNCTAIPRDRSSQSLKIFADRYALPTDVHAVAAKLPLTFGYRFTDDYGTMQSREEKTDTDGAKTGSYSFVDATGLYRKVEYVADSNGFRATVTTNEPGTMPVDPAHVRMLAEVGKTIGGYSTFHQSSPQLEYSSNIFNFSKDREFGKGSFPNLEDVQSKSFFYKKPTFEPQSIDVGKPQAFDVDAYKNGPNPLLLQNVDIPNPTNYNKGTMGNFFSDPDAYPEFGFGDKLSDYEKQEPVRYPRRHRDSRARAKSKHVLKVHIPQGYENHHDLPLYRDK